MNDDIQKTANTIKASRIPFFVSSIRLMADELEGMAGETNESDQPLATAKILAKYDCI